MHRVSSPCDALWRGLFAKERAPATRPGTSQVPVHRQTVAGQHAGETPCKAPPSYQPSSQKNVPAIRALSRVHMYSRTRQRAKAGKCLSKGGEQLSKACQQLSKAGQRIRPAKCVLPAGAPAGGGAQLSSLGLLCLDDFLACRERLPRKAQYQGVQQEAG